MQIIRILLFLIARMIQQSMRYIRSKTILMIELKNYRENSREGEG